jgi:hypothetical protein
MEKQRVAVIRATEMMTALELDLLLEGLVLFRD